MPWAQDTQIAGNHSLPTPRVSLDGATGQRGAYAQLTQSLHEANCRYQFGGSLFHEFCHCLEVHNRYSSLRTITPSPVPVMDMITKTSMKKIHLNRDQSFKSYQQHSTTSKTNIPNNTVRTPYASCGTNIVVAMAYETLMHCRDLLTRAFSEDKWYLSSIHGGF